MILLQNQKLCLRLLGQGVVLHHPQNSSVLPPREKEVGQNHQLNIRLWVGLLLGREVDLDLLKNLMRNLVHPLRKEVNQTLLQMLKLKHECHLDKEVVLDHLQRSIANPDLLLSSVDQAHLLKLKISQEQHQGHRVVLIPLLNPRLLPLGHFPDEADQVHQAKVEVLLLKEAAVLSLLQNTLPNPEWLEEALGHHHSPRLSLALHLVVTALDHLRGLGRLDSPVEVVLHLPHQRHVLELHHDADEVLQCLPQSQLKSQDPHAGGVQLHPPALRQLQGEVVLLHQSLVGSRGPVPGQGGRRPEQPDVEIGLDLLSQPLEEDSGAGQGLGLLVGVEEALVTTQGLLPGKTVHEPLDVEEVALGHPQPVGSVPTHAHHQPHGSVPGLGPLQPLIDDPGPEHPWSADVGPGHVLHQSVEEDQDLGHQ